MSDLNNLNMPFWAIGNIQPMFGDLLSSDSGLANLSDSNFSAIPPLFNFNNSNYPLQTLPMLNFPFMNFTDVSGVDSCLSALPYLQQISSQSGSGNNIFQFANTQHQSQNLSSGIFDFYKKGKTQHHVSQPRRNTGTLASLPATGQRQSVTSLRNNPTRNTNLGRSVVAEEVKPGVYLNKYKYVNISGMKPYMVDALVKMDKKAKELGYTMILSDGYRTHEQQIDVKRRKPKLAATPGKSAHEYGVAVDLGLYKNGKQVSIYDVPEFSNYALSLGMEWGGTWHSKKEPWHFNFNGWKDFADIRTEYRQWNHLA